MKRLAGIVLLLSALTAAPARANHSWGGYHWPTPGAGLTLDVGDNVSPAWTPFLAETLGDWSASPVLELTAAAGGTNPRACRPSAGQIEVCSRSYGNNGWLGVTAIWCIAKAAQRSTKPPPAAPSRRSRS